MADQVTTPSRPVQEGLVKKSKSRRHQKSTPKNPKGTISKSARWSIVCQLYQWCWHSAGCFSVEAASNTKAGVVCCFLGVDMIKNSRFIVVHFRMDSSLICWFASLCRFGRFGRYALISGMDGLPGILGMDWLRMVWNLQSIFAALLGVATSFWFSQSSWPFGVPSQLIDCP
ncbi:hypothetical protein Nepgr_018788 [Nepenthes gracilis]|uniref:Uncharacterized protein n=1 Tax=Nepenthes gracilis TaxID=150966 RepID=A0AAD3XTG4_NEPGR|nr:hypothetical protein Nepgr_018788 [Nepenthes gracilis]